MKIFILGLAKSGKTTVAKSLTDSSGICAISAVNWVKSTFRAKQEKELPEDYELAELEYVSSRLKVNPDLFTNNIKDIMSVNSHCSIFVIDGINSPRDFSQLFDYNKDIVIFLNRIDNPETVKDDEGVALNIMRDYCLWLTTMNLLNKDRWWEFNFRLPGEESDFSKDLMSRNHVTITRSLNKAISIIKERLCKI